VEDSEAVAVLGAPTCSVDKIFYGYTFYYVVLIIPNCSKITRFERAASLAYELVMGGHECSSHARARASV
jgi:hypothetical protein